MRKYYKETKKLRWDSILSQLMLLIFGEGFLQIIATSFLNAGVIGLFWNTGKYAEFIFNNSYINIHYRRMGKGKLYYILHR